MDDNTIVLPPEPEITPEPEVETPALEPAQPEPSPEVSEPDEDTGEEEVKKGASARIKELNQEVKSLSERLAEITQPATIPQTNKPYIPQYQPGEEITQERLTEDVAKAANSQIDLRLAQERAVNRIERESQEVVHKYPQLDPTSDQFDKELSDTLVEATEAMVRSNPYSASVTKFVDKMMKPYQRSIAKEVGKQSQTVAKQVSEAAMRPTGVRQAEKPAQEKSMAELEQSLGVVIS